LRRASGWRVLVAGFLGGAFATQAIAQTAPVLRARAERLAAASRCDEALAALAKAASQEPLDARAHVVAGQCQMRMNMPDAAAASFEQAHALDPKLPQLDLQLGIARFHADDLDGAARAFADARAAGTTGPEIDFYEALLTLARGGEPSSAAQALERSGLARPNSLDPAASYYAGRAWLAAQDADRAKAALDRVLATHPNTPWADAARRALAHWTSVGAERAAPWVSLQGGMEWDSNVAFLGRGLATPNEIGHQSDFAGVWAADLGTPLAHIGKGVFGVRGFYSGSAHFDVTDFDLEYPGGSLWYDVPTSEHSSLLLEAGGGYAWLGYDPYVAAAWFAPEWRYDWGTWGLTRVRAGVGGYDFRENDGDETDALPNGDCPPGVAVCGPPGVDEGKRRDRDGIGVVAGVEHDLPLNGGATVVRGGPLFERYESRGTEWDAWGFGGMLGVRQQLPLELTLDVAGYYVHRPYDSPSTYPDPNDLVAGREFTVSRHDRTDDYWEVDVRLERPITDHLTASVRYDYLRNASNDAVFDYDRHLVGAYLTYTWQGAPK
jgi:tetratricopeptide (TPR) repeat protein